MMNGFPLLLFRGMKIVSDILSVPLLPAAQVMVLEHFWWHPMLVVMLFGLMPMVPWWNDMKEAWKVLTDPLIFSPQVMAGFS